MTDDMSVSDFVLPRIRQPKDDSAELLALRIIVQSLVAAMASRYETSGAGPAQGWIDNLNSCCQQSLLTANISNKANAEKLRRDALAHVNQILGGIIGFQAEREKGN